MNIINIIFIATGRKCAYPKCLRSFPGSNLETCEIATCNHEFHHTHLYEHEFNVGVQLLKNIYFTCHTAEGDRMLELELQLQLVEGDREENGENGNRVGDSAVEEGVDIGQHPSW